MCGLVRVECERGGTGFIAGRAEGEGGRARLLRRALAVHLDLLAAAELVTVALQNITG